MAGTMIEFKANGRTAQGYFARPTSPRGHGLLVIQEYWGLVDHIKDVADRFAAEGFFALAPDLYHGEKAKSPDATAEDKRAAVQLLDRAARKGIVHKNMAARNKSKLA